VELALHNKEIEKGDFMATRYKCFIGGFALASMFGGFAARSAEPASAPTLEEIVVTAQKRAGSVQDTPFSVSATSQEQIRNSGAGNITDFARNIAGLTIADLGPGQSQIAIRGISSGQVIRDQPGVKEQVGVYLDESAISVALFTPDLELFDLDRVEVLRGPQGTLFGAGSEAGTIRYITAQPKLGVTEGVVDGSVEVPKSGSVGGSGRLAVNFPVGDTAAVRLVMYEHHLPGFIDSIQPGGNIKKDVNDGDRAGMRLSMLWKPTEQLSITPRIVYQNLSTNGYPREDVYNILGNPYTTTQPKVFIGERQQYTQQHEGIDDDFYLGDLKLEYDFGPATLTSISSYTHRKVTVLRDATQLTGSVSADVGIPEVRVDSPLFDRTRLNVTS
jgi:iron complex outermembrane receptor protein